LESLSQPKKKKTGSSLKLYFHAGTHDAIVRFQSEQDHRQREIIYVTEILPAFEKLVENLFFIHSFSAGLPVTDDIKNDCITFLYETLKKFDASRGTKAFSYFNVVAKNWIIVKTRQRAKNNRKHVNIDDKNAVTETDMYDFDPSLQKEDQFEKLSKSELSGSIRDVLQQIRKRLTHDYEVACLDAIQQLFDRAEDIDIFNKRAIFVYVRDMTNVNQKQLSSSVSVIKRHYRDIVSKGGLG
jgi:hypothetical protein